MGIKICKCGGMMNYDSYFKAYVCSSCGKMRRISKEKTLKGDNIPELRMNGMTDQELKECITEVKYSDLPKPAKKKIMNMLYDELHKKDWIPCSERMPEVPEGTDDEDCPEYIVTIEASKEATVLKCDPSGTWFDDLGCVYDVTAWQPLPEPYMRGGDLL